jgi:NAD(P)H-flavin reductase
MIIAVDAALASTYTSPGQYIEVRVDDKTGFFVLANESGALRWELILRAGGGASDVLLTLHPGAPFDVTEAIGTGFPMDEARGRPLVVALVGTGVAAGHPVVARRIVEGDASRTRVLIGIRTGAELPMRRELEAWLLSGVDVLVCMSKGGGSIEGIPFAHGYIQDALRTSGGTRLPKDCRVFAVGTSTMVEALKGLALESGIAAERVHTNH